jgi:hypothetical protein
VLACADDIGAALGSILHLVPLAKLFNLFRKVTGLTLKPSKCVMILTSISCTNQNIGLIRNWLHNNIPEWENMTISDCGKYLGFFIGPSAGAHNWLAPIARFRQRVREVHVAGLPARVSAIEYNTKCIPTLLYVAQLCPPPPNLKKAELGAIHKVLHLPPQSWSYNMTLNIAPVIGFNIRSALLSMRASMIRFTFKAYPNAVTDNRRLFNETLDNVPTKFSAAIVSFPETPGWDSPAYVSFLAQAFNYDQSIEPRNHALSIFMDKIRCTDCRLNPPLHLQKRIYNLLIDKIPNEWNSLVLRRMAILANSLPALHNSFDFYKERLSNLQPHLRMLFVKTITNAWHTSTRMHEDEILPCIFGCKHLPAHTLGIPPSVGNVTICDDTAHYLSCPILISIICDACHLEARPSLHDLFYGNGRHDAIGAVICATAFHVYHACKLGNKALLTRAISSGNFSLLRASAHSSAKAFWNEFAIQAYCSRPSNTFSFARMRDSSHLGFLASRPEQSASNDSLDD